MVQITASPQARLRKQIFTSLRFGFPLTVAGAGICWAAFLLGLDAQGWFVLGCGVIVVAAGAAMLLLAVGTMVLFAEAALRGRLRRLRRPKVKKQTTDMLAPVLPSAPPPAPEPAKSPGGPGPLVF